MTDSIVGTLAANHSVDPNGSLSMDIPIQLPPSKMAPKISLSYHSAATSVSSAGIGWVLKGASVIERVHATKAQDDFRGVVTYGPDDRFALDGQRLMLIGSVPGGNEYRYEVEQWSKIVAKGSDPANPESWEEWLPDGTRRLFGDTQDSNIKALGGKSTRVWAVSKNSDKFSNSISYSYDNDTAKGAFYLKQLRYGGNSDINLDHQRRVTLDYKTRGDVQVNYIGGFSVTSDKLLVSISSFVQENLASKEKLAHKHVLEYDPAPITQKSRLTKLTLFDDTDTPVRPLTFKWNDSQKGIFDKLGPKTTIDTQDSTSKVIPMDVHATGRSDIVICSQRLDSGDEQMHLAVHKAAHDGTISPTPDSVHDGMSYPFQLLPLDITGDGKTDLLHIAKTDEDYTLTVLLSTTDGYVRQDSLPFTPKSPVGRFYSGDFQGDGHVGLIYIYQTTDSGGSPELHFIQFVWDDHAKRFKGLESQQGPKDVGVDSDLLIIVADLNGDGAEDVFIIYSRDTDNGKFFNMDLLACQKEGELRMCANRLSKVSGTIRWKETTTFLPYALDEDGKTSLLVVSEDEGELQLQILRSDGITLQPPPPGSQVNTGIDYNGDLTLARASSLSTADLATTFQPPIDDNPTPLKVNILRFQNGSFHAVQDVEQPGITSNLVKWADIRGCGRADCLVNELDSDGVLSIRSMAGLSPQPVDYLAGYENGLGARVLVSYAPLSDPNIYSTKDAPQTPLAAVNAMARNVSLTATMSTSSSPLVSSTAHSRSQLVHFPLWVVKDLQNAPYAVKPDVVSQNSYSYVNARLDFKGRGWLGFETITKSIQELGTFESTSYSQDFPLLGQVTQIATSTDAGGNHLLQAKAYNWASTRTNSNKNYSVCLSRLHESNYEDGNPSYDTIADYAYDSFGNITDLSFKSPQPLSIQGTFQNDTDAWVIGNKTSEIVKRNDEVLKQLNFGYIPGTRITNSRSQWVSGSMWATQTVEFDQTGNEKVVKGPGPAQRTLTYDETHSHIVASSTLVAADKAPIVETAVFSLQHGKPLSITGPNGDITAMTYDVLGRMIQTSVGDSSHMTVVNKQSFLLEGNQYLQASEVRTVWDADGDQSWLKTVGYIDGLGRTWKTRKPSPDNLATFLYADLEYDGAGRIISRSRDYLAESTPAVTRYTYDECSRVVKEILPPADAGLRPITITSQFSSVSGVARCIETRSEGSTSTDQITSRDVQYLPNSEPSADSLVKPYVIVSTNELQHTVQSTFDGLGRPISVKDPAGVTLSLAWDGLSRPVERRLTNVDGEKTSDISHFTIQYDDEKCQATTQNKLTGSTSLSTTDFAHRPKCKETAEETVTYKYDSGGKYSKERLVSVTSSKGVTHNFDYDIRGNLTTSNLALDDQTFSTSFAWTPSGKLQSIKNPDGTTTTRSFNADGDSVSQIELSYRDTTRASIKLSDYKDTFSRPLVCTFGNGIIAKSSLADSGAIASTSLSSGKDLLHQQQWKIDAFSRINNHTIGKPDAGSSFANNSFQYNAAGELVQRLFDSPSPFSLAPENFSYDVSGNITAKDGKTFENKGWQLSKIKDSGSGDEQSFAYSIDGNMTSKTDGTTTSTMKYDAEGRLAHLDDLSFVYDFGGRLIKSIRANGDITYYPNQSYEVTVSPSKEKTHTSYLIHGYRRASLTTKDKSTTDPEVHYYHSDHLGSTVAVSNAKGAITTQYTYDSFGKVAVVGPDVARYKFSGKEQFGHLYYFGARFYDPEIGRFLTLDNYPITLKGIRPSTFNMYSFSRNDPINFIELNGNAPWWHWLVDAVLIAVGIALMFIPGLDLVGSVIVGSVSGAFLGAGVSGVKYDASNNDKSSSDSGWGKELGLGAAFGAASGAFQGAFDVLYPAVEVVDVLSAQGAVSTKLVGGWATRTTVRLGVGTVTGSTLGVLQQVAQNAINGQPLDKGLVEGLAAGIGTSLGLQAKSEAWGFIARLKGSGLRLKFWKNRNWRVYRLAHQAKLSARGHAADAEYPLNGTEMSVISGSDSTSHSGTDAILNPDVGPVTLRHIIHYGETTHL